VSDQFTAVEVTVKFTVLTGSSDHVLDGSLVTFGDVLQRGITDVAARAAAAELAGVVGYVKIATLSQVLDV
jgi:hypothetical protein